MTMPASTVEEWVQRIKALDDRMADVRREMGVIADERAAAVRYLVEAGVRPAEIARALGVTKQAVNHLLNRANGTESTRP